jgi:hypothetical protein
MFIYDLNWFYRPRFLRTTKFYVPVILAYLDYSTEQTPANTAVLRYLNSTLFQTGFCSTRSFINDMFPRLFFLPFALFVSLQDSMLTIGFLFFWLHAETFLLGYIPGRAICLLKKTV